MHPEAYGLGLAGRFHYAAFAFLLGVTLGILIRRTVTAMAITLAAFAALQIAMPLYPASPWPWPPSTPGGSAV
ncbi:hypothetical protein ACWEKM_46485 [Streptomyces sp. NPDC004752]